jgi:hypothetical protein
MLSTLVFAANHRTDGKAGAKEVLRNRAAGVAGPRGHEDGGFAFGHVKNS